PESAAGSDLPPLVVLDTDMGPDIDDALALAMLHTYMDREQAEIAAVTLSRNSVLGARFIDALNTWYGHPDIPVGIDRQAPHTMVESSSYVALANRFSNDVANGTIPEGETVIREVLIRAMAEQRQVVIVQVGFSGNVAALLDSRPDDRSVLSGMELVERSGAVLSIMAGSFKDRVEFNVANDVESARRVIDGWPNEMILSPFEIGYDIHYPYTAVRDRHNGNDILRQAYEFTDYSWHVDASPFYNMRTWDLTSVMEGIDPEAGWFPLSGYGRVTIDGQGRTNFSEGSGQHRVLVRGSLTGQQLEAARSAMIELVAASTPQG
ncbi:MAG: nucleoside hydrolase, partial [Actinomycetota bacterium]